MIDRQKLFDGIKSTGMLVSINQSQVDGIDAICDEWDAGNYTDMRWFAYLLATVFHETGSRMQPIKEFGSENYLKSKKYYPYYGRDFCQTTWKYNYEKVKEFTGIDVVSSPELIANTKTSAKVAVHFMVNGLYTSKKLSNYFNSKKNDPLNARRIINGTDKAALIRSYYEKFLSSV